MGGRGGEFVCRFESDRDGMVIRIRFRWHKDLFVDIARRPSRAQRLVEQQEKKIMKKITYNQVESKSNQECCCRTEGGGEVDKRPSSSIGNHTTSCRVILSIPS